jgi:peptide/nickel transport system substrate-binding protein
MSGSAKRSAALQAVNISRRTLAKGAAGLGLAAPFALRGAGFTAAQDAAPVAGGEIHFPLAASTVVNLNVIGITTIGAFYVSSMMYDGLVCLSTTDWEHAQPALAESWEVSEDGLTYTFHLRQGVTWHDGQPFTAADVEFTYTTMLNPKVGSYMAASMKSLAGAKAFVDGTADTVSGLKVIDDHTIQLVLEAPYAPLLEAVLCQHSMIPKHVWEQIPVEEIVKPETWEKTQIGTGPFKFSAYVPDRYLEFVRYDDAWRGAPLLDKVLFVHVGTTPEATAAALEAGDIDYAQLPASEFERLSAKPELTIGKKLVPNVRVFSINVQKPYLADKRIRQAIAYAIDRVGISEAILVNMAEPRNEFSPADKWHTDALPPYDYDPEKAKALLAEAGWDPNQQIELSLYYADQPHKDAIAFVQQQLGEVGIKANVVQLDGSTVQTYYYEDADFDVMLAGLGASCDFDEFADCFASTSVWPTGQNAFRYANPRVDELFIAGRAATDEAERKAIYDELQLILADELPAIPFYQRVLVGGLSKRIQDGDQLFFDWNRPYDLGIEKVWIKEG